ncbi:MAG: hypothetical protein AAGA78_06970 [Pseudomonadota bacterium]
MSFFVVLGLLVSAAHSGVAIGWNVDGAQRITLCRGATIVTIHVAEDGTEVPEVSLCPDGVIGPLLELDQASLPMPSTADWSATLPQGHSTVSGLILITAFARAPPALV